MKRKRKLFSKIYDKHIDQIYRFVFFKVKSKEIAEDLTSETFSRIWAVFRDRGDDIDNIQAFMYKTARNLISDHYRHAEKFKVVPINNPSIPDPNQDIKESSLVNSDLEMIKGALAELKEDYQNVIIWHYLEDLSISDMSKMLNRSRDATRVLLHRALKTLRKKIEQV
jgi:RNA polymerase sigma-70 factor (ECF subfamily)